MNMHPDEWLDAELEELEDAYASGDLTYKEYRRQRRELLADAKEQADRQDIIDAGRGHLLR